MVFDEIERSDSEYARHLEPVFNYINRSSRVEVNKIREIIEKWFIEYPISDKESIRKRLRDHNNEKFYSCFFELFTYNYLVKLIRINPTIQSNCVGRMYDFDGEINDKELCIETTVAYEADEDKQQENQRSLIIDYINKKAKVQGFSYFFCIDKYGKNNPRLKELAERIKIFVNTIDQIELRKNCELDQDYDLPILRISLGEWKFKIKIIPSKSGDNESIKRAVGIGPIVIGWRHDDDSLRNSISFKAKHYSVNEKPYILVCNSMSDFGVDDEDVVSALFGTEFYSVDMDTGEGFSTRKRNGVWIGPKGPRNKKLNAVLFFNRLTPWNINETQPILYINPWAENELNYDWWKWKTFIANLREKEYRITAKEEYPIPYFSESI